MLRTNGLLIRVSQRFPLYSVSFVAQRFSAASRPSRNSPGWGNYVTAGVWNYPTDNVSSMTTSIAASESSS